MVFTRLHGLGKVGGAANLFIRTIGTGTATEDVFRIQDTCFEKFPKDLIGDFPFWVFPIVIGA